MYSLLEMSECIVCFRITTLEPCSFHSFIQKDRKHHLNLLVNEQFSAAHLPSNDSVSVHTPLKYPHQIEGCAAAILRVRETTFFGYKVQKYPVACIALRCSSLTNNATTDILYLPQHPPPPSIPPPSSPSSLPP